MAHLRKMGRLIGDWSFSQTNFCFWMCKPTRKHQPSSGNYVPTQLNCNRKYICGRCHCNRIMFSVNIMRRYCSFTYLASPKNVDMTYVCCCNLVVQKHYLQEKGLTSEIFQHMLSVYDFVYSRWEFSSGSVIYQRTGH